MKDEKRKEDKIFGNDYNAGNIEFEFLGEIKVKAEFDYTSEKFTDSSYTNWEISELQDSLYQIFEEAPFMEKYSKIKKVPKSEMYDIYYYFNENLPAGKYSSIQRFTQIAEFMKMNYKVLFNILSPIDKQRIIKELDDEYNVLGKRNIKRLF